MNKLLCIFRGVQVTMKKSIFSVLLLVLLIVAAWYYFPSWIQFIFHENTTANEDRALFGDSFGSLNTLFSGLAFAGIITSIFLQSKELKETRAEIKGQKEEFKLQTKAMNKQVFETTFFQLLQFHNEIIQSLCIETGFGSNKSQVVGRDVFRVLYKEKFIEGNFIYEYEHEFEGEEGNYSDDINGHYMKFHRLYGHMVGHYFRNIYQILKYVETSIVDDKKLYTNLLRAQLSDYELGLLFYNCISELGNSKFKPLIEKYAFFEHLYLLDGIKDDEVKNYKKTAYGTSNTVLIEICAENT